MSFMKGFGSAFAESYNAGMAANRKAEADLFEKTYDQFLKKQEKIKEADEANKQDWKWAQKTAELNQLPPEAALELYKAKKAGISERDLSRMAEDKNGWKIGRDGEQVQVNYKDPRDEVPTEAPEAMPGTETPEAAAPVGQSASPTANKRDTNFYSNVSGRFANLPKPGQAPAQAQPQLTPAQQRRMERVTSKIAQTTGATPEEIRSTLSGSGSVFEPTMDTGRLVSYVKSTAPTEFVPLSEALYQHEEAVRKGDTVKAGQYEAMIKAHTLQAEMEADAKDQGNMYLVQDSEGKITHKLGNRASRDTIRGSDGQEYKFIRDIGKEERAEWNELLKTSKEQAEYRQKQVDLASAYQVADQFNALASIDPRTLTGTATAAGVASRVWREIEAIKSLGAEVLGRPDTAQKMNKLEEEINQTITSGAIKSLAEQKAAAQSLITLMAYRTGKLEGQSSRDLSNADVENMLKMIQSSNDIGIVRELMADFLGNHRDTLNSQAIQFNQNNDRINGLKQIYDYSPVESTTRDFDEFISQTGQEKHYRAVEKYQTNRGEGNSVTDPVKPGQVKPAEATTEKYPEGTVITNPKTGEKRVRRNGKWENM